MWSGGWIASGLEMWMSKCCWWSGFPLLFQLGLGLEG